MSNQITTALVQEYKTGIEMLVQQMDSRFEQAVRVETQNSEYAYYDQVGAVTAQKITSRHGDTPLVDTPHDRRRVTVDGYNVADLLDKQDQTRLINNPMGAYGESQAASLKRQKDVIIVNAFFGAAATGKSGSTSVSFPASQQVAVNNHDYDSGSGNVGMTMSKLQAGIALMRVSEVNTDEGLYIGLRQKDLFSLMADIKTNYSFYVDAFMDFYNGISKHFMGVTFIRYESFLTDGSGYTRLPMWVKSGLLFAKAEDITADITVRPDKNYSWQVYSEMQCGATRMQEKKVVEIKVVT